MKQGSARILRSSSEALLTSKEGTIQYERVISEEDIPSTTKTRCGLPQDFFNVMVAVSIGSFLASTAYSLLAPFYPTEAKSKGVSQFVVGIIFAVFPLVGIFSAPAAGFLIRPLGAKNLMLVGLIIDFLSTTSFAALNYLDGTWFIVVSIIIRMAQGLAAGLVETTGMEVLVHFCPNKERLGTVLGFLEVFEGLGVMVGPVIGGILYQHGGFIVPFLVLGPCLLITFFVVLFLIPRDKIVHNKESAKNLIVEILKLPFFWIVMICNCLANASLAFLEPTLTPHLEKFNVNPTNIGLLFLLASGIFTVAAPLSGYISDKVGQPFVIIVGLVLTTISFFLIGPAPFLKFVPSKLWVIILALMLLGLGAAFAFIPTVPLMLAEAKHLGDVTSIVSGIAGSALMMGELIGPLLGGGLVQSVGFNWGASIFAFFLFFIALLMYHASILRCVCAPRVRQL